MIKLLSIIFCRAFALCVAIGLMVAAAPIQQESGTRRIWDSEYLKKEGKATTARKSPPRRRYRVVTPQIPTQEVAGDTVIGITLWRLRPSKSSDDAQVRIIKHRRDDAKVESWTPERIPAETPLAAGQRVRLSIEAARTGYLYVVNREQYADGTAGAPYLIFPTLSLNGGDNQVSVGRIIDLPGLDDDPSYFTLEPSRPDQVGELISVIVTTQPLPEVKVGEHEVELENDLVVKWERMWGSKVGRLELEGGAGKTWTKEEKAASANKSQRLRGDSPSPQTVYYRPDAEPGEPLLVSLSLRYGKPQR
jgi:hypothetical protein